MMQHGKLCSMPHPAGTFGGIYNGAVGDANCIAGFKISPSGSNCSIQALINGSCDRHRD